MTATAAPLCFDVVAGDVPAAVVGEKLVNMTSFSSGASAKKY